MAQEKTDRRIPEQKDYRAKPSVSGANHQQISENISKKSLQAEAEELDFDFGMVEDQRDPETEDTKLSLKLMIDELTDEAVENTKSSEFSLQEELVPLYKVELEDEEETAEPERFRWEILIPAVLAVIVLIAGLLILLNRGKDQPAEAPAEPPAQETAAETPETETAEAAAEPAEETDPAEVRMNELNESVASLLKDAYGTWSVYVKDLDSGHSFVINDSQMSSASLIKLFTAGKYLDMIEKGELIETEDSAYNLMAMISWSDNDAWEALETDIGYGDYVSGLMAVTEFAQSHGFIQSGRDIGAETVYDTAADNLTTVAEVGELLEEIYSGAYVSASASERLYGLMGMQAYINKIPAGLPEGFEYASKAGDLPGIENDAAIIKGPDTDYILVVMSNDIYDNSAAVTKIVEISNLCARTLNPSIQQ